MSRIHSLTAHISRFEKNTEGAVLPIVAFSLVVLILAAGSAIDAGRGQLVKAKLSSSLDAAGLAAGATISTADLQAEAQKYFYANYPTGYLGSTVSSVTATANDDGTIITLQATATLPTTLMSLGPTKTMNVSTVSEITRENKGLELVLVVDNSGSMNFDAGGGLTRLQAVQSATSAMLDILYGADNVAQNLWIGVVPFSQAVNIGSSRTSWVHTGSFNWGTGSSWNGCVEARASTNRDVTDDPPSTELFTKYFAPCLDYNTYSSYINPPNSWYGTGTSKRNCSTGSGWGYRSGISVSTYGPNQYCPQSILALTSSKTNVLNKVNGLQAIGSTHTNLGVVWAWRMLSPRWRGLWGGEMDTNNLPLDYNTTNMSKAVIILSDGDNQHVNYNYSAYGYLSQGRLGTTSSSSADNRLDDRTKTACDSMKSNNIIIYSIAFGTTISSQGKDLMEYCASKSDYYFESPDSADLAQVFSTIGDSLASLRVSK
jgi:Flp pilus assembly protein TadG